MRGTVLRMTRIFTTLFALTLLVSLACAAPPAGLQAGVTHPEQHLGRPVGGDNPLVDSEELFGYFRLLAEQSPRVITEKVGTHTVKPAAPPAGDAGCDGVFKDEDDELNIDDI